MNALEFKTLFSVVSIVAGVYSFSSQFVSVFYYLYFHVSFCNVSILRFGTIYREQGLKTQRNGALTYFIICE